MVDIENIADMFDPITFGMHASTASCDITIVDIVADHIVDDAHDSATLFSGSDNHYKH